MEIIFKSENFIILNKPAGVLSVPSRMGEKDPRPCLGVQLQEELERQVFPVHRLDFEVSGLIMFALNSQAHKVSNRWFELRLVKKAYQALSEETPNSLKTALLRKTKTDQESAELSKIEFNQKIEWKNKVLRGKKRTYEAEWGEWAHTEAVCLKNLKSKDFGNLSLWNLNPLTGKPHQLRFHMSKAGFPILGDKLYGADKFFGENTIALRAVKLDFSNCNEREMQGLPKVVKVKGFDEEILIS